ETRAPPDSTRWRSRACGPRAPARRGPGKTAVGISGRGRDSSRALSVSRTGARRPEPPARSVRPRIRHAKAARSEASVRRPIRVACRDQIDRARRVARAAAHAVEVLLPAGVIERAIRRAAVEPHAGRVHAVGGGARDARAVLDVLPEAAFRVGAADG